MQRRPPDKQCNAYLKRVLQSHEKGKADRLQDTFLVQCVFYLLQLHYLGRIRTNVMHQIG